MSLIALAMVVGCVVVFGVAHHQDEGAPARVFQALMFAQALGVGVFAVRWLPKLPRQAATMLVLQVLCMALPLVAIVLVEA